MTNTARSDVLTSGASNASVVAVLLRPVVEDNLNTSLTEVTAQLTTLDGPITADVAARRSQRDTTETATTLAIAVAITIGFVAAVWLLRQLKDQQQTVRRRERRLSALVEHASDVSRRRDLPFDRLKVDQAFVDDIDLSAQGPVLVDTILEMAHALGLEVVAEGVETHTQANHR